MPKQREESLLLLMDLSDWKVLKKKEDLKLLEFHFVIFVILVLDGLT